MKPAHHTHLDLGLRATTESPAAGAGPAPEPAPHPDIETRADLETLLRRFYRAAFADPVIGAHFTEIAGTDLETHLPRITDFWDRALLRGADYRGDPLAIHRTLHEAAPLTARHFGRWLQLWRATVDGAHAGTRARRAKSQAERMAQAMLRHLPTPTTPTEHPQGGFIPLATLHLRHPKPTQAPPQDALTPKPTT
ncbi:group III truncated hemoglobin [Embleya hyalina]|uniref:group III truncated hemoglobin n=1 Tax=Embleya hyalina TaxID=516124 RepID=UPI001FEBD819|nr:group III truncated hemoglobin [Embleya hyalina]